MQLQCNDSESRNIQISLQRKFNTCFKARAKIISPKIGWKYKQLQRIFQCEKIQNVHFLRHNLKFIMNTSENCFPENLFKEFFMFIKCQLILVQKLLCNSQTCAKCFHLIETHEELESEFTHTNHICEILIGKGRTKVWNRIFLKIIYKKIDR